MKFTIAATLAIVGLASATSQIDPLPKCALSCFTQAIGSSKCDPTDAFCQCTEGRHEIMKFALPCLCNSHCTRDDMIQLEHSSNQICSAALNAKGQTYKPTTIDPSSFCHATAAPNHNGPHHTASTTGTGSAPHATHTSNSTVQNPKATNTTSGNAPGESSYTGGAAGAKNFMAETAFVVVVGLVLVWL